MRRLILFFHNSLDGFVADKNGSMNWIKVDEEMFDFVKEFTDEADCALYGRKTFEMMEAYWPTAANKSNATKHDKDHSQWYNQVQKIVLSKTLSEKNFKNITILSNNIPEEVSKIKNQKGKDIIIFGSPSAAHLLEQNNLIDDYWLFVNPIILGEGIPVFARIKNKIDLKFVESKTFPCGVVALHFSKK